MDARKRSARHRRKVLRRGDVRFLLCAGISIVVAAASIHVCVVVLGARRAREQKKRAFALFCAVLSKASFVFFQFHTPQNKKE